MCDEGSRQVAEYGDAQVRIMMVDPSCFSLPYDHSLCEALVRNGCHVTLARSKFLDIDWNYQTSYTVWEDFYRFTHGDKGVRFRRWGTFWKAAKGLDHLASMRRFEAMLRRTETDIIHFQWLPVPAVDSFFLRRLRRTAPLVLTLHNTSLFHGSPTSRFQAAGFASTLQHFDSIIVHTKFSQQRMLERGWAAADRLKVIPHAVLDYYRTLALPASSGAIQADAGEAVVLFFGSIKPYKGVDVLIRAYAQLPGEIAKSARLVVAGNPGMNVATLQRMARQLGIDSRVEWKLGVLPEDEVPVLFQRAAVVVLPYREIDQSGVLMTALAFGKPIIATRVGGMPEAVRDGVHGFLVEPEDVNGLAGALEKILRSPDRGRSLGEAVSQLATGDLSWDSVAKQTIKLYQRLIGQGSASSKSGTAAS